MLLGLLAGAPASFAECDKDGLVLFPAPGGFLPTNTHFILEGVGTEQARVTALVGKRLSLKAADDEVLLRIQHGWQSKKSRVAVKLTPSRSLRPNRIYTLDLERLLPRSRVLNAVAGSTQASWKIGDAEDHDAPQWKQPPVPQAGEYERNGDAVTRWMDLRVALQEESPAYVVVTLRKRKSVETQTYFVPVNGEQVRLGHDTCSGSFALENRMSYRASVEAHDCAENNAGPTTPVDVSSPAPVRQ